MTGKDFSGKLAKIGRKWESQLGMYLWREPSRQMEEQEQRLQDRLGEGEVLEEVGVSMGKGRQTMGWSSDI